MEWVKASKRHPDEKWYGYLRANKITGTENSWDQRDYGNNLAAKSMFEEFVDTEWLDEGQQGGIPLSIIEELEKANPYDYEMGKEPRYSAWAKCVSKLRSLLQSQPVPESVSVIELCKQLEEANPFRTNKSITSMDKETGYTKGCNNLRELLKGKIITTPQAISDVWDHAVLDKETNQDDTLLKRIISPDKATYLKQKFNINLSTQTDREVEP